MAGFAALIGGVGDAAGKYGQQVRGLLEERRHAFADMLGQAAGVESDPTLKLELRKHQADMLSGEPMGKMATGITKTLQKKQDDDRALLQALGGPPQQTQPQPQPGPAIPGQTPGTAAQPATSPVQPQAQGFSRAPNFTLVPGMRDIGQPTTPIQPQLPPQAAPAMAGLIGQAPPVSQAPMPAPASAASPTPAMADIPGMGTPVIQSTQAIADKWMKNPYWGAEANRPAMQAAMYREIEHNEALRQAVEQKQFGLNTGLAALRAFDRPEVKAWINSRVQEGMSPEMAFSTVGAAIGVPMQFMGPMMRASLPLEKLSRPLTGDQVVQQWPEEAKAFNIQPGPHPVYVALNRMTRRPAVLGAEAIVDRFVSATDVYGNATTMALSPFQQPGQLPTVGGLTPTPPSQITQRAFPTATGGVEQASPAQLAAGTPPTVVPGAVAPAVLPTQTQGFRLISHYNEKGEIVQELVPVTTQTQKVLPKATQIPPIAGGGTVAPGVGGGGRIFSKPMTPLQQVTNEQKLNQYDLAIGRIHAVKQDLHLLDSMIDAGKLQLEMDSTGLLRSIVNRVIPLTPAEAQFVGNFTTLTEDINLLRGPLGATGFRGPEAFKALQAQRGQLLAHPEITRQVLDNTLKAMEAQRQPLVKALHLPETKPPSGTVKLRSPDGVEKDIPADQVQHYTERGATIVSPPPPPVTPGKPKALATPPEPNQPVAGVSTPPFFLPKRPQRGPLVASNSSR